MKQALLIFLLSACIHANAQPDTSKWLRGFPVTDYILDMNDSVKLVQVELPDDLQFREKQLGLLKGIYTDKHSDTVQKGYGRCQLIKGNFYYFAISNNNSGTAIKAGDLLYTLMDKTDAYPGLVPKLASHFIRLQNVYEENFYDRYGVFRYWTETEEKAILDSMAADIRFTGDYFLENDPSMNKEIGNGHFKGQNILQVMKECKRATVQDFLEYMIARPRLYAGRQWKLAEIFATWLAAGAPSVIKG